MADEAYRDSTETLRARLDATQKSEAEARARVSELEKQVELATGSRPWRGQALGAIIVVILIGLAVALGVRATHASNESDVAQRILSLRDAQLEMVRVRDHHVCSLHFRHRNIDGAHGVVESACDTRIQCETTLYEGLAECSDHQHIVDDQGPDSDGDGRIAIDLLAGTAQVDGERFTF